MGVAAQEKKGGQNVQPRTSSVSAVSTVRMRPSWAVAVVLDGFGRATSMPMRSALGSAESSLTVSDTFTLLSPLRPGNCVSCMWCTGRRVRFAWDECE